MTKSTGFAIAAFALSALVAPAAFATPTMVITVGAATQNVTLQSTATLLGAGTYAAQAGSFDGFSYGGVFVTVSNGSLQTQFGSVTDSTQNPPAISFAVTQTGFTTGSSSTNFESMQISGSATSTNATSNQTIDFNGMVSPSSGLPTSQDSGALGLNTTIPYTASSSLGYNTLGTSLTTPSTSVSVTNTWTLNLSNSSMVNGGLLVTNLSTSTVVVPEPAAIGLFGIGGAIALFGLSRRKALASVR